MAERYEHSRGYPYIDQISAARARELHDAARLRPDADLDGDLETGFHFYETDGDGLQLVRHHVTPVPD